MEIEVRDSASADDDYVCWSPVRARVRLSNVSPANQGSLAAFIRVSRNREAGDLVFEADRGARPSNSEFKPSRRIEVNLSAAGDWTHFWIAGDRPSTEGKDLVIVAESKDTGTELGRLPVMVRVRKNAETLARQEIDRFLGALRILHDLDGRAVASRYVKYGDAHRDAFYHGIHHSNLEPYGPLFLVWHRAFLLSLERELQEIDRRVTLPYWRFDQPAPGLFSDQFMGSSQVDPTLPGAFLVEFSLRNPLSGWLIPSLNSALVRGGDGIEATMPESRLRSLFRPSDTSQRILNSQYVKMNGLIESRYHNSAHAAVNGWLGQPHSPYDPLFFLLHANVDRAWAHWQAEFDRFDPSSVSAYHAQGRYSASVAIGGFRIGSYSEDPMWPWAASRDRGTEDELDDWPDSGFDMPIGPGVGGRADPPKPADMIDYLDTRGKGGSINACYDDIGFFGQAIAAEEVQAQ